MIDEIRKEVQIPDGVKITIEGRMVTVEGPKGKVSRLFHYKNVQLKQEGNVFVLFVKNARQRDKVMIGTYKAHIANMVRGVTEGIVYKLKIHSTHFPMTVTYSNNVLTVKNFFGEKHPRTLKIDRDVDIKINGDVIEVSSVDIEQAGIVAEKIEQLTRITNRDRRVFQDGIFIFEKAGKSLI